MVMRGISRSKIHIPKEMGNRHAIEFRTEVIAIKLHGGSKSKKNLRKHKKPIDKHRKRQVIDPGPRDPTYNFIRALTAQETLQNVKKQTRKAHDHHTQLNK